MPKKVKRVELNFIMKGPQVTCRRRSRQCIPYLLRACSLETVRWPGAQRLVDAVQANMAGAPESDACTDPVVLSFFDTHRNFNSCGYTQLKAERLLDKALTREVIKKDKLGRKEPKKETTWWTRQVLTLNEMTDSESATKTHSPMMSVSSRSSFIGRYKNHWLKNALGFNSFKLV